METMKKLRKLMKADFDRLDGKKTDQQLELTQPPLQKPIDANDIKIDLPKVTENEIKKTNIFNILNDRISHRSFSSDSLSMEELSFLLWATQGVKGIRGNNYATIRTVPSAGARHPFETYIVVNRVESLKGGVYRYLALTHQLICVFEKEDLDDTISSLTLGQKFADKSAVTFIWSVVPYRGEWRYSEVAHKPMILDAGHICQNLYLACESIGCGTCAIAAYDQLEIDKFLGLDGEDEFVVYLAPVGKL